MKYDVIASLHFSSDFKDIKDYVDVKKTVNHFIQEADTVHIQCFNFEQDLIHDLKSHNFSYTSLATVTVFTLTPKELLDILSPIDTSRKCPFFSIFFEKNKFTFLFMEHYGKEYNLLNISDDDVSYMQGILPANSFYTKPSN